MVFEPLKAPLRRCFFLYKFGKDDFIFLPQIILLLKDSSSVDWKSKRSYL